MQTNFSELEYAANIFKFNPKNLPAPLGKVN